MAPVDSRGCPIDISDLLPSTFHSTLVLSEYHHAPLVVSLNASGDLIQATIDIDETAVQDLLFDLPTSTDETLPLGVTTLTWAWNIDVTETITINQMSLEFDGANATLAFNYNKVFDSSLFFEFDNATYDGVLSGTPSPDFREIVFDSITGAVEHCDAANNCFFVNIEDDPLFQNGAIWTRQP